MLSKIFKIFLISISILFVLNYYYYYNYLIENISLNDKSYLSKLTLKKGLGEPCSNRKLWSIVELTPMHKNFSRIYNEIPMPPWQEDKFLEFYKNGDRLNGETMMYDRQLFGINSLVFAECVEWNGAYMKRIEEYLNGLCDQAAWPWPAHDVHKKYYKGEEYFVELNSAEIASIISQTYYMLESKLSQNLKTKIKKTIEKRVIEPVRKTIFGRKFPVIHNNWFNYSSNWNPFCWHGIVISALMFIDDPNERDTFVLTAINKTNNYLNSFETDGYANEGVSYFNYGFSKYIIIRQLIMESTDGVVDIFENKSRLHNCALYCLEYPMTSLSIAHFGDDMFDEMCDEGIKNYITSALVKNTTYHFDNSFINIKRSSLTGETIGYNLKYSDKYRYQIIKKIKVSIGIHKYYKKSGIIVSRPFIYDKGLAATFKLLGSSSGHGHIDIGSYSISLNGIMVAGEVGGPNYYNGSSFSNKRYNFLLLNSYGHPVPVVNGGLQKRHQHVNSSIKVADVNLGKNEDLIVLDIKNAYNSKELLNLTRTFKYSRKIGNEKVEIIDEVKFRQPKKFEVALLSKGNWSFYEKKGFNEVIGSFTLFNETINVNIKSTDKFRLNVEEINEFYNSFTRVGIQILNKIHHAKIRVTYFY